MRGTPPSISIEAAALTEKFCARRREKVASFGVFRRRKRKRERVKERSLR